MAVTFHAGDCREVLAALPDGSVQTCVTSPPYFGLRDYKLPPSTWADGWVGCLGLEPTVEMFVAHIVEVFGAVRRVLRDDGTLWLNLGDSYASAWPCNRRNEVGAGSLPNGKREARPPRIPAGLKEKDLIGIPWRVAFALQADGWYLRSDIIWAKPNPMPESVTDRPTKAHEYLFLLTKSERYFYDAKAIAEPSVSDHPSGNGYDRRHRMSIGGAGSDKPWGHKVPSGWQTGEGTHHVLEHNGGQRRLVGGRETPPGQNPRSRVRASAKRGDFTAKPGTPEGRELFSAVTETRNARDVWTITTQPFAGAHFATFPPALAERCIKAGTSERGCCSACGAPWVRVVEGQASTEARKNHAGNHASKNGASRIGGFYDAHWKTVGWQPACRCDADIRPCVVLDCFGGAGTTSLVSERLGRDSIYIDLSPEYLTMARRRIYRDAPLFFTEVGS